jgi:glycosyltransferase involved in cell wall biosynthesis
MKVRGCDPAEAAQALMHVLVIPSEPFDFPEAPLLGIFQRHQVEAMSAEGLTVGVLGPQPRSLRYARRYLGLPISARGSHQVWRYPVVRARGWDVFPRWPRLQRAVYRRKGERLFRDYVDGYGRPTVLHAHNTLYAGDLAEGLSRRHGIPFVVTEHSSRFMHGSFSRSELERAIGVLRRASAVAAVSSALKSRIDELTARTVPTCVIPNVLPPEIEALAPTLGGGPRDQVVFSCIAGLVPVKNHDLLLRAFSRAFPNDDGTRLRLIGDGPLRPALERLSSRLRIADRVTFTGALDRASVAQELERSSCVVLSSRHETFGVALIEAMYFGRPVISTRCGGPEEVVEPWFGSLVANSDLPALAHALVAMRDRLPAIAPRRVHEYCVERYGRRSFTALLRRLYLACHLKS